MPEFDDPRPDNPVARPIVYAVTCMPEDAPDADLYELTVEHRGPGDRWAVKRRSGPCGATLGRDGSWDHNGITARDTAAAWREAHYLPFAVAMDLAKRYAPLIEVSGMTAAGRLEWHANQAQREGVAP